VNLLNLLNLSNPLNPFNAEDTIGGIHVPTSGLHTLRVETSTQNPASTNYYGYLVWLRLIQ